MDKLSAENETALYTAIKRNMNPYSTLTPHIVHTYTHTLTHNSISLLILYLESLSHVVFLKFVLISESSMTAGCICRSEYVLAVSILATRVRQKGGGE